jgi:hypothetical protein
MDDVENFVYFLNEGHPYFKLYAGKDWCLLKRIYVDGKMQDPFRILASSDPDDAVPGSSIRELRYFYYDGVYGMRMEGNIVVNVAAKNNDDDANYDLLTLSTSRLYLSCDILATVLHVAPINKKELPLFMTNPRRGFDEELKKL